MSVAELRRVQVVEGSGGNGASPPYAMIEPADADENAEKLSASSLSSREHLIWPQAEREGESRESR